jgi:polyprenyldihydroxybenzoate methyltransferase/3-demethylubiquinol 3-O-methyltransferase
LSQHVADVLGDRRGLMIADVGCGVGVMTAYLRRFGTVTGVDFSGQAIAAARRLVPGVTFVAGSLESLPPTQRFDLITLFDVLEHIRRSERPAFVAG